MKKIVLDVPDYMGVSENEVRIILAGELHERGKITLSQAAELAGLSYRTFLEVMGKYGFSPINISEDDLIAELADV